MTACYDRFNEVIEPAACFNFQCTLHRDSLYRIPLTPLSSIMGMSANVLNKGEL